MGSKEQIQAPAPTTAPTTAPARTGGDSAQDTIGNAAIQDQITTGKDGGGLAPARLSYRAALGELLGDALYKQLEKQVTDENLVKHAQKAVSSALGSLRDFLDENVEASEQEAAQAFVKVLDVELKRIASSAVVDSGVASGARHYAEAHPYQIATATVAAAVAYVLSNQDLPMLKRSFKLGGGHSLNAGLDIGRTMDMALKQVRVGYRYHQGGTDASVTGDAFDDGGWQVGARFQQTLDPGEQVALQGLHVDRPGIQRDRLDLSYLNPNMAASAYWQRTRGETDIDAYGASLSTVNKDPQAITAYARGEYRSDGSWEGAGGMAQKLDNWGWSTEAYSGRDATGKQDSGIRAMLKWSF